MERLLANHGGLCNVYRNAILTIKLQKQVKSEKLEDAKSYDQLSLQKQYY
ncbi:unnamed protein product [Paramecium primaurelia]|uniref:Uncharacterized protein n=1 Tax=Paramecium primaurelia TaxID=5886 RepID=A0A8S1Q046_PARPR|nr:unnamed protein product [Paramecium primaurelia]